MVKFKGIKDSPLSPVRSVTVKQQSQSGTLVRHEMVSSCIAVIIECVKHQVFLIQSCDTKEGIKQPWFPFVLTTDHDDKGWHESAIGLIRKTLQLDTDANGSKDAEEQFTDPFVLQILHRSLVDGTRRWTFRILFYTAIHSRTSPPTLRTSKESIQSINSSANSSQCSSLDSEESDDGQPCLCQHLQSTRPKDGPQRSAAGQKLKAGTELKWKPSTSLSQNILDEVNLWGRVLKSKYRWSVDTMAPSVRLSDRILYSKIHSNNPLMRFIEFHSNLKTNSKCTLAMISVPKEKDLAQKNDSDSIKDTVLVFGSTIPVYQSVDTTFGNGNATLNGHTCTSGKVSLYTLSNHEILIDPTNGTIIQSINLNDTSSLVTESEAIVTDADAIQTCTRTRDRSIECLDSTSTIRQLLQLIHDYHECINQGQKSPNVSKSKEWYNNSNKLWIKEQIQLMVEVTKRAKELFMDESRIVSIQSPVIVFGDIHGNLNDLIHYEKNFWSSNFPAKNNGFKYLFLGDYVDRGLHGLEVIMYLFCMKLLAPAQFFLLRGNHEHRQLQINFSFKREILFKFKSIGEDGAHEIWNLINDTFDCLPIGGMIDSTIFTAHGGIPTTESRVSNLLKIPKILKDPELDSPSAWEMLWNDPLSRKGAVPILKALSGAKLNAQDLEDKKRGFLFNEKRGTAFYFTEKSIDTFFTTNHTLSHLIRAHEVIQEGYKFHFQGKCITVFSSSKYQGGKNVSACIIVHDSIIRPVTIET